MFPPPLPARWHAHYPNLKILALSTESLADIPGRLLASSQAVPLPDSFVDSVDRLLGP